MKIATPLFIAVILSNAGCHSRNSVLKSQASGIKAVFIFSLDGLGYEILASTDEGRQFIATNHVTRLIPPIPSITYPSHATLIFGADPEQHGVLKNFTDSQEFAKDGVTIDPFESLAWQKLHSKHVKLQLSSMGNLDHYGEMEPLNVTPSMEVEDKFKIAMDYLRNGKIMDSFASVVWNEGTDKVGHASGPDSPEIKERLHNVLGQLANIKDQVNKLDGDFAKQATFIFVSDHGMAQLTSCVPYFSERDTEDFSHGASYVVLKSDLAVQTAKEFIAEKFPESTLKLYANSKLDVKGVLLLPEGIRFDNKGDSCEILAKGNHGFDAEKYPSQHGVFWIWNPPTELPPPKYNGDLMSYVADMM